MQPGMPGRRHPTRFILKLVHHPAAATAARRLRPFLIITIAEAVGAHALALKPGHDTRNHSRHRLSRAGALRIQCVNAAEYGTRYRIRPAPHRTPGRRDDDGSDLFAYSFGNLHALNIDRFSIVATKYIAIVNKLWVRSTLLPRYRASHVWRVGERKANAGERRGDRGSCSEDRASTTPSYGTWWGFALRCEHDGSVREMG